MKWLRFHYESINTFAMFLILGIFTLYLSFIKNKTKSSYFLIGFLAGNLIYLLYLLVGYWIDVPCYAYLKSLLLNLSATNLIFLGCFASHYHKNVWPVESRIFLVCMLLYFLFFFIPFLFVFYKLPIVYSFDVIPGYNLDISGEFPVASFILKVVFPLGLFIFIWSIVILLRKAAYLELTSEDFSFFHGRKQKIPFITAFTTLFVLKNRQARACRSFALCILGHMLWFFLYGVYFSNPQEDIHVVFKLLLNYFPVIIWLIFITVFMNNSPDSSSFTIKLVGFSVILPIVAMSIISSSYLIQHKYDYMKMKILEINSILKDPEEYHDTLKDASGPVYAALHHTLKTSPPKQHNVKQYTVKDLPGNGSIEILFAHHEIVYQDSFFHPREFQLHDQELPGTKIPSFYTLNTGEKDRFSFNFKSVISKQDNQQYRFMYITLFNTEVFYEVGYWFDDYLFYMHTGTRICILTIFIMTVILLLTVSFFIQVVIRKPLSWLLAGVDEVKKGNLNLSLKKVYNDEIGIITDSFNTMISSLQNSQHQVREYATTLEKKVEERTKKIEENAQQLKQVNIALQNEINERKKIEKQLEYNALHDPLTGLANRTLLFDHLSFVMNQQNRREQHKLYSLMFMDIDRFKIINDSLGHEFGDQLLIEIGNRLMQNLRKQDTIARIGGDEFIILMTELSDMFYVRHCADRILELVKIPFHYNGKELIVSASIGITLSSQGYKKPEDMIRDADIAMYRAKNWGRDRYAFFDIKMHKKVAEEQKLESALHVAVQKKQLSVVYQPIINQQTKKPESFEALVRWTHPELGNIPPCNFIPLAEETGLILPIGNFVLHEAVCKCKKWHECGCHSIRMSVNCSAKQFLMPGFHTEVKDILEENKLQPENLILEITESLFLDNVSEVVQANILSLKKMGILLAMDDFGTGYSSLASLNNLPIDILKIDRSISLNIPGEISMCKIISAIISLARYIDLKVVVEGIENQKQIDFLSSFADVFIQGYYYSKPLSGNDAYHYLEQF